MIDKVVGWVIVVVVIGLIALFVLPLALPSDPAAEKTAAAANTNAQELARRAIGKLTPRETWDHVEVDEKTTARDYQLTLDFRRPITSKPNSIRKGLRGRC